MHHVDRPRVRWYPRLILRELSHTLNLLRWPLAVRHPGAPAPVSIAGMVNGDLDYSMSLGSLARAAAKGLPVRVLEESGTAPQLYLVARPDIRTMADLRGKVLSPVSMGGTNSQTAIMLLRK